MSITPVENDTLQGPGWGGGVNGEIIYEWHYALNWLVGADGITEWDNVTTTT